MLREVYSITDTITESPPRIALKMFGGPFDIETFRAQKNVCYIVNPPFVSYCMLIEERQPIESIGESYNGQTKGSVKGLRRPNPGSVKVSEDSFGLPENETGLYSKFMQSNKMSADLEEVVAPPSKKTKTKEKPKNDAGLARFMCK
jgi:hypothetical protein